ncbi:MAG: orotate phosphoribosyltransferase [Nevskiales bacterium]
MRATQREFLDLALASGVLKLGEFTLKSGRQSPYFFNLGLISSGAAMRRLGQLYARALLDSGLEFDSLFGPAYKGIPLVTSVAMALSELGHDRPYAYNRKEAKTHGEGGQLVGTQVTGRVLIVDDVITAGTAVREALGLIRAAGAQPAGLLIALDRQERGTDKLSAVQELRAEGLQVISVITLDDVEHYLAELGGFDAELAAISRYRASYGV